MIVQRRLDYKAEIYNPPFCEDTSDADQFQLSYANELAVPPKHNCLIQLVEHQHELAGKKILSNQC